MNYENYEKLLTFLCKIFHFQSKSVIKPFWLKKLLIALKHVFVWNSHYLYQFPEMVYKVREFYEG